MAFLPEKRSQGPLWRELLIQVWNEQWEALLGLAGLIVAILSGDSPRWAIALYAILALALIGSILREIRRIRFLLREKHIPLIAVVEREGGETKSTVAAVLEYLKGSFDPERYRDFGVERDDWVLHQESALGHDRELWQNLCRRFAQRAQRLESLKGKTVFHVFLNCPAALAFGLGAGLGTQHRVVIYHWWPGYDSALNFAGEDSQAIAKLIQLKRESTTAFEMIEVTYPKSWTSEVFVGLHLAKHSPHTAFKALVTSQGASYVAVDNLYGDRLARDDDWFQVARETAQAIYTVLGQAQVRRINLGLSCPLPLAFTIGMALGIHTPISVYNWYTDAQAFVHVYDVDQIRQLR